MEEDFSIDYEKFCGVDGGVFIANPNAPTGLALSLEEIEKVMDALDTTIEGEGLTIGFNCKFLLDAIRVCEDGEIKMSYSNPFSGVLIEPQNKEEGTYKYFVMPIRMNN